MNDRLTGKLREFLSFYGEGRHMVLSTTDGHSVFSRMMSIVRIGSDFYFQTDINFEKCRQIEKHPEVSLCIDNIEIRGKCHLTGKTSETRSFTQSFSKLYPSSYERYSALPSERLFSVRPTLIRRWIYIKGRPYIEIMDIAEDAYSLEEYITEPKQEA